MIFFYFCDLLKEDADSGYQTGDGSVPAMVSAAKKLEGVASLSRDDLLKRIENFNSNKRGLAFSLVSWSLFVKHVIQWNCTLECIYLVQIFESEQLCCDIRPLIIRRL